METLAFNKIFKTRRHVLLPSSLPTKRIWMWPARVGNPPFQKPGNLRILVLGPHGKTGIPGWQPRIRPGWHVHLNQTPTFWAMQLYNKISILENGIKTYRNIEIRYLELVCHLFGGLNPPKEGPNSILNMGRWGSRYADVLYTLETSCIPTAISLCQACMLDSFNSLSCSMDGLYLPCAMSNLTRSKLDATQPSPCCDWSFGREKWSCLVLMCSSRYAKAS